MQHRRCNPTSSATIFAKFDLGNFLVIMSSSKLYIRNVAQPGSALLWGGRGRGFKSRRSDQIFKKILHINT